MSITTAAHDKSPLSVNLDTEVTITVRHLGIFSSVCACIGGLAMLGGIAIGTFFH